MAMRPAAGRTRPAMAASVVLFPDPEGPKSTVTPGGTSKATSSAKPRFERSLTRRSPDGGSADIVTAGELVDRVEDGQGEDGERQHHSQRRRVAVLLDGVVDGEGSGLRLARNVARDHQR